MFIIIKDKIYLKTKIGTRDKEHILMIKLLIQQKEITIINRHSSINRDMSTWSRNLIERKEIEKSTVTDGDFDISFSMMDRKSRKKQGNNRH